MMNRPGRENYTRAEWELIESQRTPRQVQRLLSSMKYNGGAGPATLLSFREALRRRTAHCLEAAITAAAILEHHGYPPLLLSLESQDQLDHVLFVYQHRGLWGSLARSRDIGLHGRRPVFRHLRHLAWSYFDPYVDGSGRITGYGVGDLRELGNYDWRFSKRNVWKVERYLQEIPHHEIRSSEHRHSRVLARFKEFKKQHPDKSPDYFANRHQWML
ncbi:MAG TPA: hypothetical protein VGO69_10550 [Pyrinomonadaceae bacterium]|jgi:hypothetical protein|nr:hypothetical protein [Pyrinomonadaceae bacterium]